MDDNNVCDICKQSTCSMNDGRPKRSCRYLRVDKVLLEQRQARIRRRFERELKAKQDLGLMG